MTPNENLFAFPPGEDSTPFRVLEDTDGVGYHALIDVIDDCAICMLDLNGRVMSWNTGAAKLKGYSGDEIKGKHFSRFYPAESISEGRPSRELQQARETGRYEEQGWRVRKDGSQFWAHITITLLRDPSGQAVGYAKSTRDLTARREEVDQLRRSEERFRFFIDGINDYAIFMLDPDGNVETWNAGAMHIKGYRRDEIVGRHFSLFYGAHDLSVGKPDRELRIASEFGRFEEEGWRVRKDGSLFWADVIITAIRDEKGQLHGFAKVTRDMSERKRREELEQSSHRISEFLATLGHELRNPLAPLRNAVNVMRLESGLSAALTDCRDMIDRQVAHLTRLVDDLLDVGRITTGKLELRVALIDIADVVARSVETVGAFTSDRGQAIDVQLSAEPILVNRDMTRLVQVLQNLLNNASKFSPPGSRIVVETCTEDRMAVLRVIDPGRGIPPTALRSIFNLFVQEDHHLSPGDTGLGIGLTLCRSLVELHRGAISAESAGRGHGSTFIVRLPLAVVAESHIKLSAGESAHRATDSEGVRILVIDGNRDSADSLAMLLNMKGCEARAAYDGEQGVLIACEFLPQLVLVDLAMPGIDGFGVRRALRAQPMLPNMLVVAMTGYGQKSDRDRSMAEGFDGHLVKPVDLDLLDALITRAGPQQFN